MRGSTHTRSTKLPPSAVPRRQQLPALRADQQRLVESAVGLAWSEAWRWAGRLHRETRRQTAEDLFGQAAIGLCRAARRYDPTRLRDGQLVPCLTYAKPFVHRSLGKAVWHLHAVGPSWTDLHAHCHCPVPNRIEVTDDDDGEPGTVSPQALDEPDPGDDLDAAELWSLAKARLTRQEFRILHLRVRLGLTLEQTTQVARVSAERARQMEISALRRLRASERLRRMAAAN
jgi:DNA-directed RNA polymerase specialized sigma subunit